MTTNRSSEELAMRDAVEAWGRARYPGARVVHELVTGGCRIDMAFVQADRIAAVEIKSSKDTLDRLSRQMREFRRLLPEVWLAFAPRWTETVTNGKEPRSGRLIVPWKVGLLLVENGGVTTSVPAGRFSFERDADNDVSVTVPMLELLWKDELLAIARRHRLDVRQRDTIKTLIRTLARKLTGDEIVAGACRALRGRDAFWKADPPIIETGDKPVQRNTDLFREGAAHVG